MSQRNNQPENLVEKQISIINRQTTFQTERTHLYLTNASCGDECTGIGTRRW